MKKLPISAGRVSLIAGLVVALAAPPAEAATPGCDIRVMRDGALRFEAFQWDRRAVLGGHGESAEVRVVAERRGVIKIGRPELVSRPPEARYYTLEYRFSIDTRRSGAVDARIRSLAGRWTSTPTVLQAPAGGLAITIYARITPTTGDGLPAGRYHAVAPVDCTP